MYNRKSGYLFKKYSMKLIYIIYTNVNVQYIDSACCYISTKADKL